MKLQIIFCFAAIAAVAVGKAIPSSSLEHENEKNDEAPKTQVKIVKIVKLPTQPDEMTQQRPQTFPQQQTSQQGRVQQPQPMDLTQQRPLQVQTIPQEQIPVQQQQPQHMDEGYRGQESQVVPWADNSSVIKQQQDAPQQPGQQQNQHSAIEEQTHQQLKQDWLSLEQQNLQRQRLDQYQPDLQQQNVPELQPMPQPWSTTHEEQQIPSQQSIQTQPQQVQIADTQVSQVQQPMPQELSPRPQQLIPQQQQQQPVQVQQPEIEQTQYPSNQIPQQQQAGREHIEQVKPIDDEQNLNESNQMGANLPSYHVMKNKLKVKKVLVDN